MGAAPATDLRLNGARIRAGTLEEGAVMRVDVTCKKCGQRQRVDLGDPGATPIEDFLHLVTERWSHRPSFECFGGHLELAPPLPRYWVVHWETLGD